MNRLVLVDTDILLEAGRKDSAAIACLQQLEKNYSTSVSVASELELISLCRSHEEVAAVTTFLQRFIVVTYNYEVSVKSVELLRIYGLDKGLTRTDALLAATALAVGIPLCTQSPQAYDFISGLELLPYPV